MRRRRRSLGDMPSSSIFSLGSSCSCGPKTSQPKALCSFFNSAKSAADNSCVLKRREALPSDFEPNPVKYAGSFMLERNVVRVYLFNCTDCFRAILFYRFRSNDRIIVYVHTGLVLLTGLHLVPD